MTFARLISVDRWLYGWRRNLIAFSCGMLATLTLAPFYYVVLLIPAYGGLYWLLHHAASLRRAWLDGWWWGWGYYMTGLYWFCIALLTDAEKFAWLIPFALFGLTAVIALYPALASWLTYKVKPRGYNGIILFIIIWTLVEYARGHLFSGFPWNLPGYSLAFSDATLQLASLLGVYGLSALAVGLGVLPVALLLRLPRAKQVVMVAYALFVLASGWGTWRLHMADTVPENERYIGNVMLRLVQANITQPHKWDPRLQSQGMQKHILLTQSPGLDRVTHVIWPETAVPYSLQKNSTLSRLLGNALPPGTFLLAGALRSEGEGEQFKVWNSLMMLAHGGEIMGTYDKYALVPFGEFLPFRHAFPKAWLTPVGDIDFSRGPGAQVLNWPGLPPVTPLICYEAIFPEWHSEQSSQAQWLLNVTNDAWFGLSTGPYQHFQMARMRAVEQGVPLVRAANTGISAVLDAYGRILRMLPLGTEGIIDSPLPQPLQNGTIFAHWGGYWLVILILSGAILIVYQFSRIKN